MLSNFRRVFNDLARNGNREDGAPSFRSFTTDHLDRIFGSRLKLVAYLGFLSLLFVVALIAQSNERMMTASLISNSKTALSEPPANAVARNRLRFKGLRGAHNSTDFELVNSEIASAKDHNIVAETAAAQAGSARTTRSTSFLYSMIFSMLSWVMILQFLRQCRRSVIISTSAGRLGRLGGASRGPSGREAAQMLSQFMQMAEAMHMPGASQRMRMALLQRDFTGEDYEMLQQLDEGNSSHALQGAQQADIDRLPVHSITAAELEQAERDELAESHNSDSRRRDGLSVSEESISEMYGERDENRIGNAATHAPAASSFSGSSATNCSICLAPYQVGDEVRTVLCMHKFHKDCVDQWLRTNPVCPICKCRAVH